MRDTQGALEWFVGLLRKYDIPFRVIGGFAARQYGSNRELADIDVEFSETYFPHIRPEIEDYIISDLEFYDDRHWRLNIITLNYKGQEIDLNGIDETYIFNQASQAWEKFPFDFDSTTEVDVNGVTVPVIPKGELIAYKQKLARGVDIEDVRQLS